jgi:hypothetical protein
MKGILPGMGKGMENWIASFLLSLFYSQHETKIQITNGKRGMRTEAAGETQTAGEGTFLSPPAPSSYFLCPIDCLLVRQTAGLLFLSSPPSSSPHNVIALSGKLYNK